jgi:hypothetical protein
MTTAHWTKHGPRTVAGCAPATGTPAAPSPSVLPTDGGWTGLLAVEREVLRRAGSVPWGLLAAGLAALWIPLKMLRVAHGDTTTALAVLDAGSKSTVVGGILVQLLPTAVLIGWAWCCFTAARQLGRIAASARGRGGPDAEVAAKRALLRVVTVSAPGALLCWLVAAAVPWPAAATAAALTLGLCAGGYLLARRGPDQDGEASLPRVLRDRPVRIAMVASVAVGALTLAVADLALTGPMSDEVWLPPHAVATTGGTLVVYVLRDDGDSRTVLQDSPRQVLVLPDADVEDERPCAPGGALDGRSFWDVTKGRGRSAISACPG